MDCLVMLVRSASEVARVPSGSMTINTGACAERRSANPASVSVLSRRDERRCAAALSKLPSGSSRSLNGLVRRLTIPRNLPSLMVRDLTKWEVGLVPRMDPLRRIGGLIWIGFGLVATAVWLVFLGGSLGLI